MSLGLCSSHAESSPDLHEYLEGAYLIPTSPHRHTGEQAPVVIGHEFSGTVVDVGEDVRGVQVGDRVVVQPILFDETCSRCKRGLFNCCQNGGFVGLSGKSISSSCRRTFRLMVVAARLGRWTV